MAAPAFNPNAAWTPAPFDPSAHYEVAGEQGGGASAAPSLDANPNGQGTYPMWDTAGKMHSIPYSLVPVARGQGYQFDTNPIEDKSNPSRHGLTPLQAFQKDEAADPNRVTGTSLPMAAAGQQYAAPAEPGSREEALQRVATAETNASLPMRVLTGVAKGAATPARPVIDAMNLGANGNTPAEQSFLMEGRTPAESAGKVAGAAAAMAPAALGLWQAPAATAIGMGAGAAAQYGAGKTADAMGANPRTSAVVGDVAGLAGGIAGGAGLTRLIPEGVANGTVSSAWDWVWNAAREALAGDVNKPLPGIEPAMSPAQRYEAMTGVGMQPNAAEATNSGPMKMAAHLNEHSIAGTKAYADQQAANLDALRRYTTDVLKGMTPLDSETGGQKIQMALKEAQADLVGMHSAAADRVLSNMSPLGPDEAGAAVQQALREAQVKLQNDAADKFYSLDRQVGGRPLQGDTIQQTAKNIYDANSAYYDAHPSLKPANAWKLVEDLSGKDNDFKPRDMSFSEVHKLRSNILELVRNNPDIVKDESGGWLQQLAEAADVTMTGGRSGMSPDQIRVFRDANQAWANMKGTFDNPSHPFYQAVRTPSPSTLVNGTAGIARTPEMVQALHSALGPEGMGPIQRGAAEKLLGTGKDGEFDFGNFAANWNKMPDTMKRALFAPSHVAQFDQLAADTQKNPFFDSKSVLSKAVNAQDASTLTKGVVQSPEAARELQSWLGPKGMGPIQRGVVEDLLRATKEGPYNFKTFQGKWNNFPEDYKRALFTPQQIYKLDDIGTAGTVLHEDLNPSGTAKQGQKYAELAEAGGTVPMALSGHPLPMALTGAYHAGQYFLSRLMNSPTFVDWLMREQIATPRMPAASPALPAAAGAAVAPDLRTDPRTGPDGQPNFYPQLYLDSKARFDAANKR